MVKLMYSLEELIDGLAHSSNKLEKQKLKSFIFILQGKNLEFVCNKFNIHLATIYRWINQANTEGLSNLQIKKGRGIKSRLTEKQIKNIIKTLSHPIKTSDGYSRGWQTKDLYQHILKKYDIKYSLIRIRELLRLFGFKKIVCRPRSKRRNEELTQEFLINVKKKEIYWVKNTN